MNKDQTERYSTQQEQLDAMAAAASYTLFPQSKLYAITPCPKPRQTRSDKWKKRPCVMRYRAFADHCRALKMVIPNGADVTFHIPMPKSWSKKKRAEMNGAPHKQTPDLDNLLKAILDAIYGDDSHIHELTIRKVWADAGMIEVAA